MLVETHRSLNVLLGSDVRFKSMIDPDILKDLSKTSATLRADALSLAQLGIQSSLSLHRAIENGNIRPRFFVSDVSFRDPTMTRDTGMTHPPEEGQDL